MKSNTCLLPELWDRDVVGGEGCEFGVVEILDSDSGAERWCSTGSGRPFTVIVGTVEDAIALGM